VTGSFCRFNFPLFCINFNSYIYNFPYFIDMIHIVKQEALYKFLLID